MFLRVFSFLILIIFCNSCDNYPFVKNTKTSNLKAIDTILDFSSVDVSPSFKICTAIIDKIEKTVCFRETIHQKIGEELNKFSFSVKDSILETVYVDLIIDAKGSIILEEIESSESIKSILPELDSLLKVSVSKLPIIYPAIKRGIPVTTKYRLPIRIQLKE